MKKRLAVIYGEKASFEIKNRPEGGVVSKIVIPFTYSEPEGEMDLLEELEELDNFDNSDDEVWLNKKIVFMTESNFLAQAEAFTAETVWV